MATVNDVMQRRVSEGLLETAELCRDIDSLQGRLSYPDDPEHRIVVQELRSELDRALMLRSLGQLNYVKAWEHCDVFNYLKEKETNLKALDYAEAGGGDFLGTNIISQGIFINGCMLRDEKSIDSWISHAQAHLGRNGEPPLEYFFLLGNSGGGIW